MRRIPFEIPFLVISITDQHDWMQDGTFWMRFEDFFKYFEDVAVCDPR